MSISMQQLSDLVNSINDGSFQGPPAPTFIPTLDDALHALAAAETLLAAIPVFNGEIVSPSYVKLLTGIKNSILHKIYIKNSFANEPSAVQLAVVSDLGLVGENAAAIITLQSAR